MMNKPDYVLNDQGDDPSSRFSKSPRDDGEAVAQRLRRRTVTSLPRDWYKGRKCPKIGCRASSERPKCFFELGGACPRLDPDAYDQSPYIETADKDCHEAADEIDRLSRQLAEARSAIPTRDELAETIYSAIHIGNMPASKSTVGCSDAYAAADAILAIYFHTAARGTT